MQQDENRVSATEAAVTTLDKRVDKIERVKERGGEDSIVYLPTNYHVKIFHFIKGTVAGDF